MRVKSLILLFIMIPILSFCQDSKDQEEPAHSLETLLNLSIKSANKIFEKVGEIPASVAIVSRKEIESYGYPTLAKVLESIPGIYNINSYIGGQVNLGMRGFWNSRSENSNIAILVNGVSQKDDFALSNPFSKITLPISAIDRIEVIRGPMSVIYGNGASFGVINIVTNDSVRDKEIQLSQSYGTYETLETSLRYASNSNTLSLSINASIFKTNGLDHKIKEMIDEESAAGLPLIGITDPNYSFKDLLEMNKKYLNIAGKYKEFYFDFAYNESESEQFFLFPSVDNGTVFNISNTSAMLGYQREISNWLNIDTKFIYNKFNRKAIFDIHNKEFYGVQYLKYDTLEAELLTTITPIEDLSIITGFNYRSTDSYETTDAPSVGDPSLTNALFWIDDDRYLSYFTQLQYKPFDKLKLIAGLRMESFQEHKRNGIFRAGLEDEESFAGNFVGDDDKYFLTPRIAAVYSHKKNHIFKLMYGEATKISESGFDPEETLTIEFNYILGVPKLTSHFNLFYNQLDKLITREVSIEDEDFDSTRTNAGRFETLGVELILSYEILDGFSTQSSITLQQTKDKRNSSIEVAYSPKVLFNSKWNYQINNYSLSLIGNYVGSMEPYWDPTIENSDGTTGNRIGENVKGYFVLDANLRINDIYKGLYFNIRGTNLLNEEIRYPTSQENILLNRGTIGPAVSVYATLGWKY